MTGTSGPVVPSSSASPAGDPAAPRRRRIGLFGGTFDPVHVGHLALARWAREGLQLDELRLLPTGESWQKARAGASAAHRAAMARLAIEGETGLVVDDREVRRAGPSYTVDTLAELRTELGPEVSLVWLLGSDQLHNLATWHRWRELTDFAHLAATRRERIELDGLPAEVDALLAERGRDALPDAPAGSVVIFRMPVVPVSATALRARLAEGERPAELVPPGFSTILTETGSTVLRTGPHAEEAWICENCSASSSTRSKT